MTKTFSTLAVVLAGLGSAATAQSTIFEGAPFGHPFVLAETTAPDAPDAAVPCTGVIWFYRPGIPACAVRPEVMERSIDIAVREGVLGNETGTYRTGLPGPGQVGFIQPPVPEGWVILHRCLERADPSQANPDGQCLLHETRPLLGNPLSVAWD